MHSREYEGQGISRSMMSLPSPTHRGCDLLFAFMGGFTLNVLITEIKCIDIVRVFNLDFGWTTLEAISIFSKTRMKYGDVEDIFQCKSTISHCHFLKTLATYISMLNVRSTYFIMESKILMVKVLDSEREENFVQMITLMCHLQAI